MYVMDKTTRPAFQVVPGHTIVSANLEIQDVGLKVETTVKPEKPPSLSSMLIERTALGQSRTTIPLNETKAHKCRYTSSCVSQGMVLQTPKNSKLHFGVGGRVNKQATTNKRVRTKVETDACAQTEIHNPGPFEGMGIIRVRN